MEEQQDLSSHMREVVSSSYPKVIGHFRVEQKCFVILTLGHCSTSLDQVKMSRFRGFSEESKGTRFEINGHTCIILETDQCFDRNEPFINSVDTNPIDSNQLTVLSDRELQIAQLVALGQSNKQIAQHLSISKWTVLTHLRRIFAKLGVDSRAAMVYQCASLIHGNSNLNQHYMSIPNDV